MITAKKIKCFLGIHSWLAPPVSKTGARYIQEYGLPIGWTRTCSNCGRKEMKVLSDTIYGNTVYKKVEN